MYFCSFFSCKKKNIRDVGNDTQITSRMNRKRRKTWKKTSHLEHILYVRIELNSRLTKWNCLDCSMQCYVGMLFSVLIIYLHLCVKYYSFNYFVFVCRKKMLNMSQVCQFWILTECIGDMTYKPCNITFKQSRTKEKNSFFWKKYILYEYVKNITKDFADLIGQR